MTRRKAPPVVPPAEEGEADVRERDRDRVLTAFQQFVDTIPDHTRVSVSLRRLPSYVHPQTSEPESLPPPNFVADLEQMEQEVRRRYGPGRYKLYIRIPDEKGYTKRFTAPTIFLAPTADDIEPGPEPGPGDSLDSALDRMATSMERESKARTVAILMGKPQQAEATGATGLNDLKQWVEVLRVLLPQSPDPLTLLKTARDLLVPPGAGPTSPDATLSLIEKTLGIVQGLGVGEGGARRSTTEVVISGIVELAKSWGPYLPAVVRAVAAVQQQARAVGPTAPATAAVPTAHMMPLPNPDVLLQATGGDPQKSLALGALLNLAFIEMTVNPQAPEDRQDSFGRVAEFSDARLPGFTQDLLKITGEQVWTMWVQLDPRMETAPGGAQWLADFLRYLATPPPEDDGHARE